jgi:undecaprenyl-diphosphatase
VSLLQAGLFGVIQGLTEFIPVSSTAHLLIGQYLLGISSTNQMFSFQVIIQLGTVFALLAFFREDFFRMLAGFLRGIRTGKPFADHDSRLGWLVLLATLPALVAGFLLKEVMPSMFGDPLTQAGVRLLVSAFLLASVEIIGGHSRTLESASWLDALAVGLFQVLALFPGASRSGATIAGGIIRGLDRPSAARFAFLMSAPILVAAGLYETVRVIELPGTHAFLPHLLIGFAAAALVGWLAIKWLLDYLNRHSLYLFAGYCAVLGTAVLLLQRLGLLF